MLENCATEKGKSKLIFLSKKCLSINSNINILNGALQISEFGHKTMITAVSFAISLILMMVLNITFLCKAKFFLVQSCAKKNRKTGLYVVKWP